MQILKGKQTKARRVLIYGENGVGKSTFACRFPYPVVLNLEDGVGDIEVDQTPLLKSTREVEEALITLYHTEYQTIIVDTIDWLEQIIFAEIAKDSGKPTIGDIGYGKGYQVAERRWQEVLKGFNALWKQGRHVVFVAHAKVEKFQDPSGDTYNYWSPALDDKCSGQLSEWCDEVLFAKSKINTIQKDEGFGAKRSVAIGGKERILLTNESAAQVAKNRLGLPDELPLSFEVFSKYLPKVQLSFGTNNVEGLVVNGSSKVGV